MLALGFFRVAQGAKAMAVDGPRIGYWGAAARDMARRGLRWSGALRRDRRGAIAVTMALLAVPIVMVTGAAVDYARLVQFKTQLQETVDSAALAGAAAFNGSSGSTNAVTVANNYLTANEKELPGHVGSLTTSVTTGTSGGDTVTVQATAHLGTTFLRVIASTLPVSASASALVPATRVCILITDPSSSQSFLVNGGANLNAPNCEIDVASTSSGAAMIDSSLSNIAGLCVAGGTTVNGGASVNNLQNDCTTATNPYVGAFPAPSMSATCNYSNENYSGSVTLQPGTYCGGINFNGGTVTFAAGNYVFYNVNVNFNGSGTLSMGAGVYAFQNTHWNLNSGWNVNGSGVTFYYADSSSYIQFNSNVGVNLSAPTSGTYANVLMFEPDGLSTSSFAIDGSSSAHLLQGLIYLPSRNITFNSTANVTTDDMTLVAHQVIFDTLTWSIAPSSNSLSGHAAGGARLTM
jgi:Flp pilus assembly protein TadG